MVVDRDGDGDLNGPDAGPSRGCRMCTLSCANDNDCPAGSRCIDESGGVCIYACVDPRDCAPFGAGYTCVARDLRGSGGQALVCRVP